MVLGGASAHLAFGPACTRQLPAQSSLVIRTRDGCVYPSIVEVQEFAQSQNLSVGEDGRTGMGAVLLGGGLTAAALAALLLLSEEDDNPVSPP